MTLERKFIAENIKRVLLKEYLKKKVERAGFGGIDIQRTPMGTRVTLIAERPGMIIGRKGTAIKDLTDIVAEEFKFDNPQIEVQEEKNPSLNPHIMAHKLAAALERGWHFRRAGHSTVRRIMAAGAKGCQVIISGKLIGQRHRVEKFKEGHIKYCGEPARIWMNEGVAVAKKKTGVIGIKVQIMDPHAKLPDEIEVRDPLTVGDIAKIDTKPKEPEAAPEAKPEEAAEPEPEPAKKPSGKKTSKKTGKKSEAKHEPEPEKTEPEPKEEKKDEPSPEPEPEPEPPVEKPVPEEKSEPKPEESPEPEPEPVKDEDQAAEDEDKPQPADPEPEKPEELEEK